MKRSENGKATVKIAVVGKYFNSGDFILSDVYLSVLEAIKYSAYQLGLKPDIHYLSAQAFENDEPLSSLDKYDGVLIPGGFGITGIKGKLKVIEYVRQQKIPYFGICYGMQLAVVEYTRNVLGRTDTTAAEFKSIHKEAEHYVIDIMADQKAKLAKRDMGGTMRLGEYPAELKPDSLAFKAYGTKKISERHRHRYEVNQSFVADLEASGLHFSDRSPDGELMEIMELEARQHPFFVGVQFHPEFHARPLNPHPLFTAFIEAASKGDK